MTEVISVKFKDSGRSYYFSPDGKTIKVGDKVIVETQNGNEFGIVSEANFEVEDEKIIERMSGRRICSGSGASYHILYKPSKVDNVCDACGASLYTRTDDAAETVLNRLETYHSITEPLKEYYSGKGNLVCVEGREKVEDTSAAVIEAISKYEASAK